MTFSPKMFNGSWFEGGGLSSEAIKSLWISEKNLGGLRELTRSDFKRVDLKGCGKRYYFSFSDINLGIEICLEPTFSGFDVGVYSLKESVLETPALLEKKKSIKLLKGEKVYKDEKWEKDLTFEDFMQREILYGTLERSEEAWEKALKIANDFYRSYYNTDRLKKWNLIKDDFPGDPGQGDQAPPSPPPPQVLPPDYPISPPPIWSSARRYTRIDDPSS